MDSITFGSTQLTVSSIGLGCWELSGNDIWSGSSLEDSQRTVQSAFEAGVTFFDVAPIYGLGEAEKVLGSVVQVNNCRNEVTIATKCGLVWDDEKQIRRNLSKNSVLKEADESLRRLRTDYIDVYQLHWPDPNNPIEETMEALALLKKSGKIRFIGVSNFSLSAFRKISDEFEVVSYQGLYNLFERNAVSYHGLGLEYRTEREILPYCQQKSIQYIPYSPLFQGLLAGKMTLDSQYPSNDVRSSNPKLTYEMRMKYESARLYVAEVANIEGVCLTTVSLAWLLSKPQVGPVICGAMYPKEIKQNMKTLEYHPKEEVLLELDQIYEKFEIRALDQV